MPVVLDGFKENVNWQSICSSTLLTNIGAATLPLQFSDVTVIRISQSFKGSCLLHMAMPQYHHSQVINRLFIKNSHYTSLLILFINLTIITIT